LIWHVDDSDDVCNDGDDDDDDDDDNDDEDYEYCAPCTSYTNLSESRDTRFETQLENGTRYHRSPSTLSASPI
jgi:hypothetical protein